MPLRCARSSSRNLSKGSCTMDKDETPKKRWNGVRSHLWFLIVEHYGYKFHKRLQKKLLFFSAPDSIFSGSWWSESQKTSGDMKWLKFELILLLHVKPFKVHLTIWWFSAQVQPEARTNSENLPKEVHCRPESPVWKWRALENDCVDIVLYCLVIDIRLVQTSKVSSLKETLVLFLALSQRHFIIPNIPQKVP